MDIVATSKIDDDLTEHGGLIHVPPLTGHLDFFWLTSRGGSLWNFLTLWVFFCGIGVGPRGFPDEGFGARAWRLIQILRFTLFWLENQGSEDQYIGPSGRFWILFTLGTTFINDCCTGTNEEWLIRKRSLPLLTLFRSLKGCLWLFVFPYKVGDG